MDPPFSVSAMPPRAVMGILNVTPDSFSDGGRFLEIGAAVRHGLDLIAAGADVLDIGGESTRPGAAAVGEGEERRRVEPVIRALAGETDVPMSVDTTKASVASAALTAGAMIVNDVSGGADPEMLGVVASAGAGFVAMHMQGEPRTMQDAPHYEDVGREVAAFLVERMAAARSAGVRADGLLADPGLGFGKTASHNLELLARLPELAARVGVPLVVGASRKSFIGAVLGGLAPEEREEGTLATTVWAFERGAAMVRVHDVATSVRAARLLGVISRVTPEGAAA